MVPSFEVNNAAGSHNLARNRQLFLALGTNLRKESIKPAATHPEARNFVTAGPEEL